MKVSVEKTSWLGRRMTVQIPADQLDQQVESKLQQLATGVRLDGFRPGKVPVSVVKQHYGDRVRQEAAGELITSSYEQAIRQENLRPTGKPSIEQVENQPGKELQYAATFEIYPDIELPELSGIAIERISAEITDTDVENMLEKLRIQRVTWINVKRAAANGDRVEIDYTGSTDSKPFAGNTSCNESLQLGTNTLIPGFDEQLIGVSAGESKTIEVVFPENYGNNEIAGKTAAFEVMVHAVAAAEVPQLDDEFARSFGFGEGGLEKLRDEVRRNLHHELQAAIKSKVKQQVFNALLKMTDIEVPASLIDSEITALINKDEISAEAGTDRGHYQDEARRRVAMGLLIAEISKRNQIQVDPSRVREAIENLAQAYENPDEVVQWYYTNQDALAGIQTLVMEDTVVEWVTKQATVTEKSANYDEIMQS